MSHELPDDGVTCRQATAFGILILSPDRLASLIISQVMDLTGFELCNASLLDEATAAAEAMSMIHGELRGKRPRFFVDRRVHPQTLAVVQTRAAGFGITVVTGDLASFEVDDQVIG